MTSIGTRLFTRFKGQLVGKDEYGNQYFQERITPKGRHRRRWVIYDGEPEASKVPAEWHLWLHRVVDELPSKDAPRRPWQKPHVANQTGTVAAYRPPGHELEGGRRPAGTGDYEPWIPS